jgi:hypothetical protein
MPAAWMPTSSAVGAACVAFLCQLVGATVEYFNTTLSDVEEVAFEDAVANKEYENEWFAVATLDDSIPGGWVPGEHTRARESSVVKTASGCFCSVCGGVVCVGRALALRRRLFCLTVRVADARMLAATRTLDRPAAVHGRIISHHHPNNCSQTLGFSTSASPLTWASSTCACGPARGSLSARSCPMSPAASTAQRTRRWCRDAPAAAPCALRTKRSWSWW